MTRQSVDQLCRTTDEQYWLERMAGQVSMQDLPMDYPRSSIYTYDPEVLQESASQELADKLACFCQEQRMSEFVVMFAAYVIWQHLHTFEEDLLTGVPLYNDSLSEASLMPVRLTLTGIRTVSELLGYVKEQLTRDIDHSSYPFALLADSIFYEKDSSRPPGFSTVFHMNQRPLKEGSFSISPERFSYKTDLVWNVLCEEGQLLIEIEFNNRTFRRESIRRYINQYKKIVLSLLRAEETGDFRGIQMLSDEELSLYDELNRTESFYEKNKTIPQRFFETVEKFPDRIALSSDREKLTYTALNERSNQVARMLASKGFKKGDFAAIFMERSVETVISILGILKAGGVYVPIDPDYPAERGRYLLQDSGAAFILTKEKYSGTLHQLVKENMHTRIIVSMDTCLDQYEGENFYTNGSPSDLAYVIYTSGSTGKPKGTLIGQEAVMNLVSSIQKVYQSTEEDIHTQFFSFSFDPSVAETFMSLFSGARLHLLSSIERMSIEEFAAAVERIGATHIILPTAFFNQLAAYSTDDFLPKFKTVKTLSMGGELLTGSMVREWQKKFGVQTDIINLYGPTECTVIATANRISDFVAEDITAIPIGRPLGNYKSYILNQYGQLCPVNVPGELCIGGAGLARGYFNRPEKTAEVFVPHPFSDKPGRFLYRTGDIVRLLPDGTIDYIGRKDSQVKVRGFRIEIGEIEDIFSRMQDIGEVAVIARRMDDGNNTLTAYFTSDREGGVHQNQIRDFLGRNMPAYMIPDRFIQLEEMPLSPTGKIDRKKLEKREEKTLQTGSYAAPQNDTQQILAEAWKKVLGLDQVGIHDDFFYAGGHSLKILQILVLVKKHFPFLKIQNFFEYRTIADMDMYIASIESLGYEASRSTGSWEVKDLAEPPRLQAAHTPVVSPRLKAVLVTGATGYLGSYVLYELLKQTDAEIYCLVRLSSSLKADARLREALQHGCESELKEDLERRVIAVEGDFSREGLDLSPEIYERLVQEIDAIIHCGADVRHFGEAGHFNKVNTLGTRHLLDLASQKPGIHFHHVSTLGIPEDLAISGQWEHYAATGDFAYDVTLENVYTQSKLQAENLVREAAGTGIPVTIYRAGNLTCHSVTGKFQQNIDANAFYRMIKAMVSLKKAPKANWYVDLTPIDYASRALVNIVCQADTNGRTFHLCNPSQITYTSFIQHLQDMGYSIEMIEADEYQSWLLDETHPEDLKEFLSMAIAQLEGEGARDSDFRFSCPQTKEFLEGSGINCAVPDRIFIETLLQYGMQIGYFPLPNPVAVLV